MTNKLPVRYPDMEVYHTTIFIDCQYFSALFPADIQHLCKCRGLNRVFCAPPDARRRRLCIARFHGGVKTDSRRCVSFPPHKRCAGLCGGFGEVWHGRVSGCSTRQSGTFQKIFSRFPVQPHTMKPAVTPPSCTNRQGKRLSVRRGT